MGVTGAEAEWVAEGVEGVVLLSCDSMGSYEVTARYRRASGGEQRGATSFERRVIPVAERLSDRSLRNCS